MLAFCYQFYRARFWANQILIFFRKNVLDCETDAEIFVFSILQTD